MKRFLSILLFLSIWGCTSSFVFQQMIRTVFSLQVSMQPNSQLFGITAYIHNGRTLTSKKHLTKDEFVFFASGKWPSIYNQQRKDLLAENGINCGLLKDEITKKDLVACSPLDSIWKIRYSDYPFNNKSERGWSRELYKPSSKQIIYLNKEYGITDIDFGYFIDTSFWKIMRDIQDENWIKKYKNL